MSDELKNAAEKSVSLSAGEATLWNAMVDAAQRRAMEATRRGLLGAPLTKLLTSQADECAEWIAEGARNAR